MKLSDYILKPQAERRAHIDLFSSCEFGAWRREPYLDFHEVEDDIGMWLGTICRCHACPNDTHYGGPTCTNPLHIYLGTPKENSADRPPEKAGAGASARKGSKQGKRHKERLAKARSRAVVATHLLTGERLEFPSGKAAAEALGVTTASISRCVNGKRPSCKKFQLTRF